MPTVAEQLRRAREQQALSVYQVAEITKIKTDHIRALESGRFESFSAPVYVRGFVRTYAKLLKLDVERLIADLDVELGQTEKFRELPSLTGEAGGTLDFLMLQLSRMNWRIVLTALAAGLIIIVLAGALRTSRPKKPEDALKDLGPGLYQPKRDSGGELLPLPAPGKR